MTRIRPGSLRPVLGPLPCVACGRPVVWGVAVQEMDEAHGAVAVVNRRDLYDASGKGTHECPARQAIAA